MGLVKARDVNDQMESYFTHSALHISEVNLNENDIFKSLQVSTSVFEDIGSPHPQQCCSVRD